MRRREFIKSAGCFVATASMGGLAGCGGDENRGPIDGGPPDGGAAAKGSYRFAQGVASGAASSSLIMRRYAP